jgi:hypothetical protein
MKKFSLLKEPNVTNYLVVEIDSLSDNSVFQRDKIMIHTIESQNKNSAIKFYTQYLANNNIDAQIDCIYKDGNKWAVEICEHE